MPGQEAIIEQPTDAQVLIILRGSKRWEVAEGLMYGTRLSDEILHHEVDEQIERQKSQKPHVLGGPVDSNSVLVLHVGNGRWICGLDCSFDELLHRLLVLDAFLDVPVLQDRLREETEHMPYGSISHDSSSRRQLAMKGVQQRHVLFE